MSTYKIKIATDYSDIPYGRYPRDSDSNGEKFREEMLVPLLRQYSKLTIDLDGTEGFGSSFLEEAFGGLVRDHGYTSVQLQEIIDFISIEDDSYPDEIWGYIKDEEVKRGNA